MGLHNLKPAKGSVSSRKRIARGQGSGRGGTSTRGHKGAKSRSGYSRKRAFEGGQMPLQMRLPKRGFNSPNRVSYEPINLDRLQTIVDKYNLKEVTPESLIEAGVCKKTDKIKILGSGELSKSINVTAHAISATAKSKIEAQGGSATALIVKEVKKVEAKPAKENPVVSQEEE